MTDPSKHHLYDSSNGALGAFQGAQLGTGMAPGVPAIGTPLSWALTASGVSLEDVLRFKIMNAQQQLGLPQGLNGGYAGLPPMQQVQMPAIPITNFPSPIMNFPFLPSTTSPTYAMPPNRDMATLEDPQYGGVWRAATGFERQVSVMSRSKGIDRRVVSKGWMGCNTEIAGGC